MNDTSLPSPVACEASGLAAAEVPETAAAFPPPCPSRRPSTTDVDDIVARAVEAAKQGDMDAARVVWRFVRWRCAPVVIEIGEVRTAGEIAEAQSTVLKFTFAGHLTPVEGSRLSGMIENRRRALHTLEQQRQLDDMMEFARQHAPGKAGRR